MRVRIGAVDLTLRGVSPHEARAVVDGLPAAIAFAFDHPGRSLPGPSGAAGRAVAAAVRAQACARPRTGVTR